MKARRRPAAEAWQRPITVTVSNLSHPDIARSMVGSDSWEQEARQGSAT
jgi:transcriptional regulator of nitric oxide reductase